MLHRCVYYQVPRARLQEVCAAVRGIQRVWVARVRGLHTELLLRVDAPGTGPATVMEVWRWEPGATAASEPSPDWAVLERELGEALAEAQIGPRHVEDFACAPG